MSARPWTAGPWEWSDDYQCRDLSDTWSLIGKDGFGILSCDGVANSPQFLNPADAQLISAAPDLAEALIAAREFIRNGIDLGYIRMPDADTEDPAHETAAKIDAALAKAGAE